MLATMGSCGCGEVGAEATASFKSIVSVCMATSYSVEAGAASRSAWTMSLAVNISILPRTLTRTRILTLSVRDWRVVILDNRGDDLVGILCIGVLVDPFLVGINVVKTDRCRARGYVSVSILLKSFATNGVTYARWPERWAGQPESLHNAPGWCCGWPLERCL
jgi:hypothetical protein